MDPYTRARTVRIGKWRWPPPKDEQQAEAVEGFLEFKMRKMQERRLAMEKKNQQQPDHQLHPEDDDGETVKMLPTILGTVSFSWSSPRISGIDWDAEYEKEMRHQMGLTRSRSRDSFDDDDVDGEDFGDKDGGSVGKQNGKRKLTAGVYSTHLCMVNA